MTDYVRGIGQLLQYEFFYEKNITENKSDIYSENFKTLYLYPDDVIKNNDFNISILNIQNQLKFFILI